MKVNELISDFSIWTSNEEAQLLKELQTPIKLSSLSDRNQVIAQPLIRKSLVSKIGQTDPVIVKNEKNRTPLN